MGGSYPRSKVDLGHGRGWLTKEAAASIRRIDREIGHPVQITEAGRTWLQQDKHWQKYLRDGWPLALNPDTPSIHQIGDAVDSDEAQRFVALMARHGWVRTVYRWVNGVWTLVERWHFEYFPAKDQHRNDPAPSGGTTTPAQPKPPVVIVEPTLGEIMAFKSIAISYWLKEDERLESVALDWETGEEIPLHNTAEKYNASWAAKLTEGGLAILTKGHYDNVLAHFRAAKKRREDRELELARAR